MFENPEVLRMASASAAHAAARLSLTARNVANADTPGYRATDLQDFASSYQADGAQELRATRRGHLTGASGNLTERQVQLTGAMSPNGNSVSLEEEMMRAATIRQDHDQALAIYKSALSLLRTSLGRR